MDVSLIGALVCAALMLLGFVLGSPIIIGLFGSLALSSTSIATIHALGGASPLIYTVFVLLLIASVLVRRTAFNDLGTVLAECRAAWLVCGLAVYSIASAIFFPRLFAGEATVFVASRVQSLVMEVPLGPVSGNISQTGYFVLSSIAFFAICIFLLNRDNVPVIRRGFFAWCTLNAVLGLSDFAAKLAGAGDIIAPIRTANYAIIAEAAEAGFWRIAGGHAEASSFGAATLACVAFAFTYWRRTQSSFALVLSAVLLFLLLLSTSTTAYVGLAIISMPLAGMIAYNVFKGRLRPEDIILFAMALLFILAVAFAALFNERILDPFVQLFQATILDKPLSTSAQERSYWNQKSLLTLFDTAGLGVGFGSSRASSWLIAVISQIGIVGAIMQAALVAECFRRIRPASSSAEDIEFSAVAASARASALAGLVGASIAGGTADPGLLFFVSLAVVLSWRMHAFPARRHLPHFQYPSTHVIGAR